jgi:hypothetical protein
MHTLTALDFASEADVDLGELHQLAQEGKTVANIDLSEYGIFEHHGDKRVLTKVQVPSRLLSNLGPGGVSETTDADAFRAGKEAVGRVNPSGGEQDTADETETVEPEVEVVEQDSQPPAEKESGVPAKRSNPSATVGQVFVLGGALAGVTALCKMLGVDRNSGPISDPLR